LQSAITELNKTADEFIENNMFDVENIKETRNTINDRFQKYEFEIFFFAIRIEFHAFVLLI